jgi:hypothetical protein
MAEDRTFTPVNKPVNNSGVLDSLAKLGNYLSRITSSIFGGASEVTIGGKKYLEATKKSVDPVISALGETAKQVQGLTLLGALVDPNERTPFRRVYETASSVVDRAKSYATLQSAQLDDKITKFAMTPQQVMDSMLPKQLPPRSQKTTVDRSESSSKTKKKKKSKTKFGHKPQVKVSKRRR